MLPGHPLVHLVEIDEKEREEIHSIYDRVGFTRHGTFHWMGKMGDRLSIHLLEKSASDTSSHRSINS